MSQVPQRARRGWDTSSQLPSALRRAFEQVPRRTFAPVNLWTQGHRPLFVSRLHSPDAWEGEVASNMRPIIVETDRRAPRGLRLWLDAPDRVLFALAPDGRDLPVRR